MHRKQKYYFIVQSQTLDENDDRYLSQLEQNKLRFKCRAATFYQEFYNEGVEKWK